MDAVAVTLTDVVGILFEVLGDFFDDVFHARHALRAAEAAERGIGRKIGFAHLASDSRIGKVVGVVTMEHGAFEDGWREVRGAAAVGVEVEREGGDAALGGEANLVKAFEGVALAGGFHIVVFIQHEARGAAGVMGDEGGHGCGAGRHWVSLPPKPPPMRLALTVMWLKECRGFPRPAAWTSDGCWVEERTSMVFCSPG